MFSQAVVDPTMYDGVCVDCGTKALDSLRPVLGDRLVESGLPCERMRRVAKVPVRTVAAVGASAASASSVVLQV